MSKLSVINMFAGPGAGKSTTAAGVFYALKSANIRAELVTESAKDATYEGHKFLLSQQIFLFADQLRRQARLNGKREVIVTDSPILLPALVYNDRWDCLPCLAWEAWKEFDNINYFIKRAKEYDTEGRNETYLEALDRDADAKAALINYGIQFDEVPGNMDGVDYIVRDYLERREKYAYV